MLVKISILNEEGVPKRALKKTCPDSWNNCYQMERDTKAVAMDVMRFLKEHTSLYCRCIMTITVNKDGNANSARINGLICTILQQCLRTQFVRVNVEVV